MQLFTITQSKSLLVSPYYACLLSLSFAGQHGGAVTLSLKSSAGPFHRAHSYHAIHDLSPSGQERSCDLFPTRVTQLKEDVSKCMEKKKGTPGTVGCLYPVGITGLTNSKLLLSYTNREGMSISIF